jgi:hypothetical protein
MRIRDPGSGMETVRIRDPEWKKVGSGIRDKHPGFATLAAAVSSVPVGTAECGDKTRVDLVEHLLNPVKDGLHLATRYCLAEVL